MLSTKRAGVRYDYSLDYSPKEEHCSVYFSQFQSTIGSVKRPAPLEVYLVFNVHPRTRCPPEHPQTKSKMAHGTFSGTHKQNTVEPLSQVGQHTCRSMLISTITVTLATLATIYLHHHVKNFTHMISFISAQMEDGNYWPVYI